MKHENTHQNELEKSWLVHVAEVLVPPADVVCTLLILLINNWVGVLVVVDEVLDDLLQDVAGHVREGDGSISITNICKHIEPLPP